MKEEEDMGRWPGLGRLFSTGYCFFRVRTTCPPLRRAIELEMSRDVQMEM